MKVYGSGAGTYWFINDHLGAPRAVINDSGQTVWKAAYLPFGKAEVLVDTIENNFRLPGQYYDAETGLHYNMFRYYDPDTGRYITADPVGLNGGLNLFAYAGGDPVNAIDLDGKNPIAILGVAAYFLLSNSDEANAPGVGDPTYSSNGAAGMATDAALGIATIGIGGKVASMLSKCPKGIKGTQKGLRDPKLVDKIKKDMLDGNYRFSSPEGKIGGWVDDAGTHYVGEGHHRMAAAQKILRETGDASHVNRLISNGSWTKTAKPPSGSGPLPMP